MKKDNCFNYKAVASDLYNNRPTPEKRVILQPVKATKVKGPVDPDEVVIVHKMKSSRSQKTDDKPTNENKYGVPVVTPVKVHGDVQAAVTATETPSAPKTDEGKLPNLNTLPKSISRISNVIRDNLVAQQLFDDIKGEIRTVNDGSIDHDEFYKRIQNCIYYTLSVFCGTKLGDQAPPYENIPTNISHNSKYLPTLHFLDRMYNDKALFLRAFDSDPNRIFAKYNSIYADHAGIQTDWISLLSNRIQRQIPISVTGVKLITNMIKQAWCLKDDEESCKCHSKDNSEEEIDELTDSSYDDDSDDESETEEVHTDELDGFEVVVTDDPNSNDHVLTVKYGAGPFKAIYPFYVNIDNTPSDVNSLPSLTNAGDINGKWDGLVNFPPAISFKCADPSKYLEINDMNSDVKVAVLHRVDDVVRTDDDTTEIKTEYYCGIYRWKGIVFDSPEGVFPYKDNEHNIFDKTMYLIHRNISSGDLSHLESSISDPDIFMSEEKLRNELNEIISELNAEEDDEDSVDIVSSEDDSEEVETDEAYDNDSENLSIDDMYNEDDESALMTSEVGSPDIIITDDESDEEEPQFDEGFIFNSRDNITY